MSASHRHAGFAGLFLSLAVVAGGGADSPGSVHISECLLDNARGLQDEDGERPGWVEVHNAGRTTISLDGWFLTDNATNRTRWRFPNVTLLPDKQLLVFASGKSRAVNVGPLHASFRLSRKSRYVALVDRATNVVSAVTLTNLPADVAWASVRGEPALRGPCPRPTPGKANASSGPGFAPEITFSRPSGNFIEPFTIALATGETGAVIHYTLDGTLPGIHSGRYTAPLPVTNSLHLRARAYKEGLLPGPPHSAAYLRLASNALVFHSKLPVLVLDTLDQNLPVSAQGTFVRVSVHEPVHGRASLTNAPALTARAGFRVRGSTSAGMPQPGFALEFLDEFNQERPLPLVGLPADSDWILYAPNAYDPVLIHNPFVHQLSREMGRYSPRTRFVEVFLSRSAGRVRAVHYHGLHVLMEKVSIGKHRLNIHRLDADDLKPPQVTGGYLLKFDRLGPGEQGLEASNDRGMVFVEPREAVLLLPQRAPQREYLKAYIADFHRALHGPAWQDPEKGYRAFLDVEAAIDFHVLELLSGNVDAMVLSTYFHKPRGGRIICGPHWDFDRALGSIDERDADPRVWSTGPFFGGAWWPRLFSDPDFWQLWVDRWQGLCETQFSLAHLHGGIDRLTGEVREAQPRQYQRWGLQPRGGSYDSEIRHMKDWLSNRLDFIDRQLVSPPRLAREPGPGTAGMLVTLAAPTNSTIYYTLDGSDPRLPQGAVSTNALIYTNPIPLAASARLVARARDPARRQAGGPPVSTPWSRPVRSDGAGVPPP